MLEAAIDQLNKINDLIPDNNTCKLTGNTHHIGIEGDERIIDNIVKAGLASLDIFDEEDELDQDLRELSDTEIED